MFVIEGAPDPSGQGPSLQSEDLPEETLVEAQRAQVLEAVAECCAERGYGATTVSHVVDRAGISKTTFYGLFRDKEDCFIAAANLLLGDLVTSATTAYSPDKPLVQVVHDAAKAILEMLAARPAFASLAFLDYRTATPRALELYQSGVRVLISLLDQVRADSPQESPLPSSAARGALGGAEALLRNEIAAGRATQLPQILPEVVYSCLVPYLGLDEALLQAERAG